MDATLCVACKGGRNLCGRGMCHILENARRMMPKVEFSSSHIFGRSPPSVFVGRHGYPDVLAGPMLPKGPIDDPGALDLSPSWYGLGIEEVVGLSSSLIRPVQRIDVRRPFASGRFVEVTHALAMAEAPVETEVLLERAPPAARGVFDFVNVPLGPSMLARRADLTENPRIPRPVDALVSDGDAGSVTAIRELKARRVDEHHIQKLLSVGLLGRQRARRMVPTRWAITAVDDQLGKALVPEVMASPQLGELHLHRGQYHGNYFHILLIPGAWAFEMREAWLKGALWTGPATPGSVPEAAALAGDWEDWRGRKSYASNVTGAYYSARLAVLEHLTRMNRQAAAMVYREITDEYWAPLGVWVIREAVRAAMAAPPERFGTLDEAVSAVSREARVRNWHRRSWMLNEQKSQRRLEDFAAGQPDG